jgi:hypothetical protein
VSPNDEVGWVPGGSRPVDFLTWWDESLFMFRPVSEEAELWVEEHIDRDGSYQPFWPTVVVERRDLVGLLKAICDEEFLIDPIPRRTGTINRIEEHANQLRAEIEAGVTADGTSFGDLEELDRALDISDSTRLLYQERRGQARLEGRLTAEEAKSVDLAVGEAGSSDNGGWPIETDLSLKMTVTNLMFHLSNKRADA